MFIGGTTLLTEAYAPEERAKAQAAHDFIVFGTVAITAFASGVLHENLGWIAVNLIAAVPVSLAFLSSLFGTGHRSDAQLIHLSAFKKTASAVVSWRSKWYKYGSLRSLSTGLL